MRKSGKRRNLVSQSQLDDRERDYFKSMENTQLHNYRGQGSFDIFSKGFDCLGRVWGLVEFPETQKMGWLDLESHQQSIEMIHRPRRCEGVLTSSQCLGEIKSYLDSPEDFLGYDEENHIVYIRLGHNSLLATNEMDWRQKKGKECQSPSAIEDFGRAYRNYKLSQAPYREDSVHDNKASVESHFLTLTWISHYNERSREENTDGPSRNNIEYAKEQYSKFINFIEGIKTAEGESGTARIHVLTEEDKKKITPVARQVIEIFESEFEFHKNIFLTIQTFSENRNSGSLYMAVKDQMQTHPNTLDLLFFIQYLFWAYEYVEFCLERGGICMTRKPVEEILDIGKELIQHGLRSDFAFDRLIEGINPFRYDNFWFHPVPSEGGQVNPSDHENRTYSEMMSLLEPHLQRARQLSGNFDEVQKKLEDYYSSFRGTEFEQLKIYKVVDLKNIGFILDTVASYINKQPPPEPPQDSHCRIDLGEILGKPYLNSMDCRHFYHLAWKREYLEQIALGLVNQMIEEHSQKVKSIQEKVDQGQHPSMDNKSQESPSFSTQNLRQRVLSCNYSPGKTTALLKKLQSQNSCITSFLLPAEDELLSEVRGEGIHFNVFSFGESGDRMAVKLKPECQ